ncbi:MAG: AMP-binding protein, partial [Acidobacteriota bacterium]
TVEESMHTESISSWFENTCSKWSKKKAITFLRSGETETVLTYSQLGNDVSGFAETLIERDVAKGDRVLLFLEKSLISVVAHLALQKIGGVTVPLNPGFKKSEMQYLLKDADAALVLADEGKGPWIREIDSEVQILELPTRIPYQEAMRFDSNSRTLFETTHTSEDPGMIIYTSGTTGDPKGAVLTQKNLVHDATNVINVWEINQQDVLCHALPLFHVHGLCFALHTALLSGVHVMMLDRFDPAKVLNVLASKEEGQACTIFMAVPAMYTRLLDAMGDLPRDFLHIRLLTSGSAPLLVKDFHRIERRFGRQPVEREGMSETGMNFSNPLKGERKPGSIGLPLPGLSIRIVNPDTFADVSSGENGEIWLKSPSITPGYWRKPKETKDNFENGWFRTGDLGNVDEDGYYYLTDRIKHIIITGGENVSAKEVETVINRLDNVVESAVVGIPDPKWGEKVVAAVVTERGCDFDPDTIKTFCKEHLHDWKCPKEIIFVEEIPRNTMGKVLKDKVKRIFGEY